MSEAVTKSAPPLVGLLEKMGPELARALPAHCSPERMARIALTALRMTPKLVECTPASFLGSVMSCAQLGLEPNTPLGHAYLIPRKIKGRMTCTLLIGYQGMLDLADRSGRLAGVQAHVVHEGDTFSWSLGLAPTLTHVPSRESSRKSKPITHVYAVAQCVDGPARFRVLTLAEVLDRKARGGSGSGSGTSPWSTDFEAMACKTAVRALWPWLPKSPEMARAAAIDTATETGAPGSAGWDPAVTDVLAQHDIVDDEPIDAEAEVRDVPRGGLDRLGAALSATKAAPQDIDDDEPLPSLDEVAERAAAEYESRKDGDA